MGTCPSRLAWRNPLGEHDIFAECSLDKHQGLHEGPLFFGTEVTRTTLTWADEDRRVYTGEFPGWCQHTQGCVLPRGHTMAGSGCQT